MNVKPEMVRHKKLFIIKFRDVHFSDQERFSITDGGQNPPEINQQSGAVNRPFQTPPHT